MPTSRVMLTVALAMLVVVAACSSDAASTSVADLGKPCLSARDCEGGRCMPKIGEINPGSPGYCSAECDSADVCRPGWTCTATTDGKDVCQCAAAVEVCDGLDNDCNGVVDENCSNGKGCDPGFTSCAANRPCVDLLRDPTNCGACNHACSGEARCEEGQCRCLGGGALCGDRCVDTQNDRENCGNCGTVCEPENECKAGVCVMPACGPNRALCNGVCTVIVNDPKNCGACGKVCTGGTTCRGNQCVCGGTYSNYQCANGACVNLLKDPANCGGCGLGCGPGGTCVNGLCGECAPNCTTCGEDGVCRAPVSIDPIAEQVGDFALGASTIFAATSTATEKRVVTFGLDGSGHTVITAGSSAKAAMVAGDGGADFAFAADATPVSFARLEGCPGGVCAPLLTMAQPMVLEVHGGYAYWVTSARLLQRCALTGCGGMPETLATLPSVVPLTVYMKVDASGVYLVDAKSLMRVVPGSPIETLHWVALPNSMALDGDRIYVMETHGTIVVSKTAAFVPTTYYSVLEGVFAASQITTDGAWVYFLARAFPMGTTATIWRCAAGLVCTDPQIVARNIGPLGATILANDAAYLYTSGSKLYRYPK